MNLVCPACATTNRVPEERLKDQPVCGRCSAKLLPTEPVALDDTTFPKYVANTELPVLVDFWADWCAPCRMMAPHFANAARQLPGVRFVKVDSDASPQTSASNDIASIPTLILYRGGKEVARQSGAMPTGDLVRWGGVGDRKSVV